MKFTNLAAATLFSGMSVAPAIALAQTAPKVVASPTPNGQMVTPDQAHQDNKAPPLSDRTCAQKAQQEWLRGRNQRFAHRHRMGR